MLVPNSYGALATPAQLIRGACDEIAAISVQSSSVSTIVLASATLPISQTSAQADKTRPPRLIFRNRSFMSFASRENDR